MYSSKQIRIILLLLLGCFSLSMQAQYRLSGSKADGTPVAANDIFLLNDSCTLYVQDSQGDTVRFRYCEWNYDILFSDRVYQTKKRQADVYRFGIKVDESLKEYSQGLHRIVDKEKGSVYFSAKFKLKGTTQGGANIRLEIPIYLNVLPNIPNITYLSLIDIGEYQEAYDCYYYGKILLQFDIERTDRYMVSVLPLGGIYQMLYFIDDIKEDKNEITFFAHDDTYSFYAINKFGSVKGFESYDFTNEIYPPLSINNIEGNAQFKLHPNPVKDILFIDGETESIQQIQIMNAQGQFVNTYLEGVSSIDVSSYPRGFYFVKISVSGKKDEMHKILKE